MAITTPILQIGQVVIVPMQGDLHDQLVQELQEAVLRHIEKTSAKGLILDVSALEFVDSFMARVLNDIASMAGLMGTHSVLVGMTPAIATILMDLGLQLARVPTARDLERGLALLEELIAARGEDAVDSAGG